MILTNHPELGMSIKTLYNYIDQGHLLTRNVDLKRKAKFKPRKSHKTQITDREIFQRRTYTDFSALGLSRSEFVEMDTVLSTKGSLKCILTLYFPHTELLLAHLMDRCTPGAVRLVFEQIRKSLGGAYEFISVFPLILTTGAENLGLRTAWRRLQMICREPAFIIVIPYAVTRKAALKMSTPCFA